MIRWASRDDIPACARIIADREAATDCLPVGPGAPKLAEIIGEVFEAREVRVSGDPEDGYRAVDPERAGVGGLYRARRGEGLGRAFLDKARTGRDFLWLTVFAPNMRAFAVYRRTGVFAGVDSAGGRGRAAGDSDGGGMMSGGRHG